MNYGSMTAHGRLVQVDGEPRVHAWLKQTIPAGEDDTRPLPGDFILVHRKGFISACIRFGQRLRFHGERRKYAHWSHAALIVSAQGDLVEALTHGVERTHISKYRDVEYVTVTFAMSDEDRAEVVDFAERVVGERYGFVTIACLALRLATGCVLDFGVQGTTICSGLVARALERAGAYFGKTDPQDIMPADLAEFFGVA